MIILQLLAGILVAQAGAVGLFLAASSASADDTRMFVIIGALDAVLTLITLFWFSGLIKQYCQQRLEKAQEKHARDRENIRVHAERQKARIREQSHKQLIRETRRARLAANLKAGGAMAGALLFGIAMLSTQFVTLGLMILSAAAGGAAGFWTRAKLFARLSALNQPGGTDVASRKKTGPHPEATAPVQEPISRQRDQQQLKEQPPKS